MIKKLSDILQGHRLVPDREDEGDMMIGTVVPGPEEDGAEITVLTEEEKETGVQVVEMNIIVKTQTFIVVVIVEEVEIDMHIEMIEIIIIQVIEMNITKAEVRTERTISIIEKEKNDLLGSSVTRMRKNAIASTERVVNIIEKGVEVIDEKEEKTTFRDMIKSILVRIDLLLLVTILMVILKVAKVQLLVAGTK